MDGNILVDWEKVKVVFWWVFRVLQQEGRKGADGHQQDFHAKIKVLTEYGWPTLDLYNV